MLGPLTYLDAILLVAALVSGIIAAWQGVIRDLVVTGISALIATAASFYVVMGNPYFILRLSYTLNIPPNVAEQLGAPVVFVAIFFGAHLFAALVFGLIRPAQSNIIDRILGFAFGAFRGFVLVVIPYMFYESFVPDPNQQFPWVREASSLPYIKSTGNTFRTVLTRFVTGSLMGQGEQRGFLLENRVWHVAVDGKRNQFVIYTRTAG